jgi:hypothetical protein
MTAHAILCPELNMPSYSSTASLVTMCVCRVTLSTLTQTLTTIPCMQQHADAHHAAVPAGATAIKPEGAEAQCTYQRHRSRHTHTPRSVLLRWCRF